jgi:type IV pilus assembly protein PilQ
MRGSGGRDGGRAPLGGLWLLALLAACAVPSYEVEVEKSMTATDAVRNEVAKADTAIESPPPATRPADDAAGSAAVPAVVEERLRLRDVNVEALGPTRRVVLDLSRPPDRFSHFRLDGPPRLVIDVSGPDTASPRVDFFPVRDGLVRRIRTGHYEGRMRVVVDLHEAGPAAYSVREEGGVLVAYLGDVNAAAIDVPPAVPAGGPESDAVPESAATTPLAPPAASLHDESEAAAPPSAAPEGPARLAAITEKSSSPEVPKPRNPVVEEIAPRTFTGQRISLDFKDADVQNVLRVIADVSGLNVVATDDVTGKVTLHLVDVPWDQALDIVLKANRLKMVRDGNVVRISTVERLREEQEALRAQHEAETELEPLQVRYVRVNYARADKELVDKVKGVLTERGSAAFDDRTNTIIIRDIGRGVDDAGELVRRLDTQSPQVLIEANLVEATIDFARALGVQWGYRRLQGPQTGNPTGSNFPGTVNIGGSGLGTGTPAPPVTGGAPQPSVPFIADFPVPTNFGPGFGPGGGSALDLALGSISGSDTLAARLTALEEEGKGKIISRPRVITLNNVPATIQSLTILRVKLPSTGTVVNTGTGGAAGTASTATEKINTGITLVVTPQVSSDGYVLLNINAKSSQADFTRTVDSIPVEISREANSNVLIRDGETVVLGGIFRNEANDTETGLPYLRRVPGLGWLFKRMLRRDRKEELIVFITPQVVAGYGAELPSAVQLWEDRHGG